MSSSKPVAALRELGVPLGLGRLSLKRIYKLDVYDVRQALQAAAGRRIHDKQVWDALLYRTALLRSELKPLDLALTVDALGKARRRDTSFIGYMFEEVRSKVASFEPRDTALLLNSMAKLDFRDEFLTRSLLPSLLRRMSEKTRWEDLALLALSYARLGDSGREPVFDRIVSVLLPRIDAVKDGHTLSVLACAFAWPRHGDRSQLDFTSKSIFAVLEDDDPCRDNGLIDTTTAEFAELLDDAPDGGDLSHVAFIEVLLQQCELHMWSFQTKDILHLCLALGNLQRYGHSKIFPLRLLKRIDKRLQALYYSFQPAQLIHLLDLMSRIPELEKRCASRVLDEASYGVRQLTAQSCLVVLRAALRAGNHPRAQSAVAWRLTRSDASTTLPTQKVCEAVELFAAVQPHCWEHREALLALLHGLQKRRQEPDPPLLARLLRIYGELAVRDSHWFHISGRLNVKRSESKPNLVASPVSASISEQTIADAVLGLARLDLPQLIDGALLFSRAAAIVETPTYAAAVLEAAAILDLTERRPEDMKARLLKPLVSVVSASCSPPVPFQSTVASLDGEQKPVEPEEQLLPPPLQLFPFTDVARLACDQQLLLRWQSQAASAAEHRAASQDFDRGGFWQAVDTELQDWKRVGLKCSVLVGPFVVPWAVSFEGLAAFLAKNPLSIPSPSATSPPRRNTLETVKLRKEENAEEKDQLRGRGRRKGRGRVPRMNLSQADHEEEEEDWLHAPVESMAEPDDARPETHVLIQLLQERDFYHASPSIRSDRQRSMGQMLKAERRAEVRLLRRHGWHVCCIPEQRWTFPPAPAPSVELMADDDEAASRANQALIFELVAQLSGTPGAEVE